MTFITINDIEIRYDFHAENIIVDPKTLEITLIDFY